MRKIEDEQKKRKLYPYHKRLTNLHSELDFHEHMWNYYNSKYKLAESLRGSKRQDLSLDEEEAWMNKQQWKQLSDLHEQEKTRVFNDIQSAKIKYEDVADIVQQDVDPYDMMMSQVKITNPDFEAGAANLPDHPYLKYKPQVRLQVAPGQQNQEAQQAYDDLNNPPNLTEDQYIDTFGDPDALWNAKIEAQNRRAYLQGRRNLTNRQRQELQDLNQKIHDLDQRLAAMNQRGQAPLRVRNFF